MAWETKSRYYSGQGVVLMGDTDTDGNPTGLLPVGNVSSLKVSVAVSTLEHKESQSGQRGVDLRMNTEVKCSVSMVLESLIADNLAIAMRANVSKKAQGNVTGELSKVYLGFIMPLKNAKVSTVVIKTVGGSPTTLVAYTPGAADGDWDYILNAEAGSVKWATNPVSAIVDGDEVTVDYARAAQQHIDPLTASAPEKFMRFEGLNTAEDLKPVIVEVFRLATDPLKELDLINENLSNFTLDSSALMDTRRPVGGSKYFRQIMVD